MIRKLFTTFLCLLLALCLPLSAMAAREYTLSAVVGDEITSEQGVKDLMDALSLRVLCGDEGGMLAVALGGTDALSFALRGDANGIYVQSAMLGEAPLYFAREDIINLMTSTMRQSAEVDEAAIAAATQSIDQMFAALGAVSAIGDAEKIESGSAKPDAAHVAKMFADDPAVADYITGIFEKMKITDGDYTDAAHDPATQMAECSITREDLLKLAESKTVMDAMTSSAAESGATMTPEQASEAYIKALEGLEINIPMTVYTADAGETLIAAAIPMSLKGKIDVTTTDENGEQATETEDVDFDMNMVYNRLTADNVVTHTGSMAIQDENEEEANFSFTATEQNGSDYALTAVGTFMEDGKAEEILSAQGVLTVGEKASSGWLGIKAAETQLTIDFNGKDTDVGKEKVVALYLRQDATSVIEPSASDRPLITFKVDVNEKASEDALAAVNAATVDSSVQLLNMGAQEQETALTTISSNAMSALYTVMGLLPVSTLQMFMGPTDAATTAQ